MEKEEIRKKVIALKRIYMNVLGFVLGNALFFFIWLIFDSSNTFWPKYIFLVWAIALIVEAFRRDYFPLLTPEWEERKIEKLIGARHEQHRIPLSRHRKKEV